MNLPTIAALGLAVAIAIVIVERPIQAKPAPAPVQGTASWYGDELRGRPMANGKPFDPTALTCASWHYPLGTRLRVNRVGYPTASVIVTVTDRGPRDRRRIIDLSRASFAHLADPRMGLIEVTVHPLRD